MNASNVAIVFAGQNALDQSEIRLGVLRIPEVTQALRDAQTYIEKLGSTSIDLRASMLADDRDYLANPRLRSLLTAIVQVALYERWNKTQGKPNYLIGHSNLDSPLQFAAGRKGLEDIIRGSALLNLKPLGAFMAQSVSTPILGGIELVEYEISILNHSTQQYICIRSHEMDALRLFSYMADQLPIDEIVNVGPGCPLFSNYNKILTEKKIKISDSINIDPMLNWFWSSIKPLDAISQ